MSGKTFGQKFKCLGLNRDFQANPGGFCLERGYFGQKSKCLGLNRDFQANSGGVLSGEEGFCLSMQLCAERKRPPRKI